MGDWDGKFLGHATSQAPTLDNLRALPRQDESPASVQGLRVEREGIEPLNVRIYRDRVYTFGRATDATYVFPSDSVSRFHGQLSCLDDARWVYRDLGSRNGSWLPGAVSRESDPRLTAEELQAGKDRTVSVGDVLLLGNKHNRLVFTSGENPEEALATNAFVSQVGRDLQRSARICARHALPVFLLGASGSGKTWLARQIHDLSKRSGPFVIVNCGRLASDTATLHSELLGHVKGAFTGTVAERIGKFQAADQGTLFLDEVESLPKAGQDFLIDLLDGSGSFAPLGAQPSSLTSRPVFRLISASKLPLARSGLRADLAQRLATGEMVLIPGLSSRADDIPVLVAGFVLGLRQQQGIQAEFTDEALATFLTHDWPGEIRELEATVRTLALHEHSSREFDGQSTQRIVIGAEQVLAEFKRRRLAFGVEASLVAEPPVVRASGPARRRPSDISSEDAHRVLAEHGGNKTHAAKSLGMALNTFKSRLGR